MVETKLFLDGRLLKLLIENKKFLIVFFLMVLKNN